MTDISRYHRIRQRVQRLLDAVQAGDDERAFVEARRVYRLGRLLVVRALQGPSQTAPEQPDGCTIDRASP